MFLDELLVKVTHVQIEVLLSILADYLLGLSLPRAPLARHPAPPVQQPVKATGFIPLLPAAHLALADADHLRRLPPLIFLAVARKSTSCNFIAGSTAALG
jgi:hypothetical protein